MQSSVNGKFEMVAKTMHGLEDVLATEIRKLGGTDIEIMNRAVRYLGDKALLYRSNLYLRTAIRILIPVMQTQIKNQIDLYARIREYEWEKHLRTGMTIAVDTSLNSPTFTNSQFVSMRAKDAIADRMREKFNRRPSVNKNDPDLFVNVHLTNNDLTVSIDTSGASLHKRGYRVGEVDAPINEILAAGLIMLTGWHGETDFYDPMCGSGTIGIEAALIARDIPPGIFRTKYGFENHPDFDQELWTGIFDNIVEKEWKGNIFSSDISKQALISANKNARQAAVHKNIIFRGLDFENFPAVDGKVTAILNPPYGQRMILPEIVRFYKTIGNVLKKSFIGSDVWLITSNLEALKFVGLKPSVKLRLFNGPLECRFCKFSVYEGSQRKKAVQKKNNLEGDLLI
jgi:putative N6-adenine-specific DNA methylase